MTLPSSAPVTTALVALVGAAGDGRLPDNTAPPFAVVYPLPGGDTWGPIYTAPQAGAQLDYQVTSVDISRAGVEAKADQLRQLLFARDAAGVFITAMPVSGLVVLDRELIEYGGLTHERGVFNIADTIRIHVTVP